MVEPPRAAAQLSVAGLDALRGAGRAVGVAGEPGADVEYRVGAGFRTNRCWLQGRARAIRPVRLGLPAFFELDDGTGAVPVHVQTLTRRHQAEFSDPEAFPEFALREGAYVVVVGRMFIQGGLDKAADGGWFIKAQKLHVLGEASGAEADWKRRLERVHREFYSRLGGLGEP